MARSDSRNREYRSPRRFLYYVSTCFIVLSIVATSAGAQISFVSAINLALQNSPAVKAAQNDVQKAQAALSIYKDIYIPSVVATGGVGYSYGITLSVPTIFTINAQSLVFSSSQMNYIRAARMDLQASMLALADAREQVEEDTAVTYLSLSHAQDAVTALREQQGFALKLVSIAQDRLTAGVENQLDMKKSRRAAVQIKLNELQAEDELGLLREHLGYLMGISGDQLTAMADSIPSLPSAEAAMTSTSLPRQDTLTVLSAEANAKAKRQRALGDSRYTWKPQVTFSAQYGRVSPINNVSDFYNLHGNYNAAFVGVQIQFPFLDRVRSAAAKESLAEASHAARQVEILQDEQIENRLKLQHSIAELSTKCELAELDQGIAQDELKTILIQLKSGNTGRLMTPEDEQNARIQERQKYLDLLDAKLQVFKAEVSMLRQTGQLGGWLQSLIRTSPVEDPSKKLPE